ncbi:cyclic nucleotide-binding domain-containing protein [Azospirillum sp. YIM B02556]|uniref:Cyclic nucleotide-binding domain-containing protein n=1 Tax=Azospirillum endophyticum TaxID=2800326 RepID=A0ABS1FAE9_9PROT|nr:cyclic nucleotide-binding domain-containing protein [Azospirillum endophyticum]MBK1840395.1 cyclic nucleotide-binding domain-containing protein [Azospirillum endophyticum]
MSCVLARLCTDPGGARGVEPARPPVRCRGRLCRRGIDLPAIRSLPLFESLEPAVICRLLGNAPAESHPRNSLLFQAGDQADAFFIVLSGRVKLFALTEGGRESIVETVEPVSSFAEAAIFAGVYPIAAEVVERAELLRVGARGFLAGLRANPAVACRMLGSLLRWERRLAGEMRRLRSRSPMERVAELLVSLTPQASGETVIVLPMKKLVIASRLGMEPESLSRVLGRLREFGVHTQGRTVRVEDVARLHALCAPPPGA